jgi:hypothetical protein
MEKSIYLHYSKKYTIMKLAYLLLFHLVVLGCNASSKSKNNTNSAIPQKPDSAKKQKITTVNEVPLPKGFQRKKYAPNSFANYLQHIPLKANSTVYLYNGTVKPNQNAQYAVLDISVPNQDLQQCADAVMRLRAEYLYQQNRHHEIVFVDNENIHYTLQPPYNRTTFESYLLHVFGMCGSASLEKQLKEKNNWDSISPGDVIIKGGFPGHAVIVMDVAEDSNGQRQFTIAQSYMPAQDIHLLQNPNSESTTPWYQVSEITSILNTPEYQFSRKHLRTW